MRSKPRAVVIGSGFGGLAAAVRLGARGFQVTVLEQLDSPGGRARTFHRDGFTFDAGPTIITAPFLLDELWALCGKRLSDDVELKAVQPFYRIRFHDGDILDCSADAAAMKAQIERLAPGDFGGYEAFLRASEAIYAVAFERLAHVSFDSVPGMLRLAPQLMRLRAYRSVYGLAASFVKHPKLRFALSFHPLFVGGNPFSTTAVYALIAHLERRWGVHCAIGGTGSIVRGLVGLIDAQGGAIRYRSRVAQICTAGRRVTGVRLADDSVVAADIVVSNADAAMTYRELVPRSLLRRWTAPKIERAAYSMSLFVWYFGTRCGYADVPHHTILVGPRYAGLLRDIFDRKVLADDFSLYLHRPTASDPSLAPPGCDAFYVLSPVPNLSAGIDWPTEGENYRQRIALELERTLLPRLRDNLVTSHVMTPLDFQDDLRSFRGTAFGMAPTLLQSAWFRPHNRSEDVKGLYLVGAGTHPGAGIPGVLSSAKILDTVVPDGASFDL